MRRAVTGQQLLLLQPGATTLHEHVNRAHIGARHGATANHLSDIGAACADDHRIALDRHRAAKAIARRAVVRDQHLLFGPDTTLADEDANGSLVRGSRVGARRADNERVVRNGHGHVEEVARSGLVIRRQCRLLGASRRRERARHRERERRAEGGARGTS
jgi:hypothetical protein